MTLLLLKTLLATFYGGVIVAKNTSSVMAKSCIFHNNSARNGGMLYGTNEVNITVDDSRFGSP